MKKKLLSFLLAGTMAGLTLTGCGNDNGNDTGTPAAEGSGTQQVSSSPEETPQEEPVTLRIASMDNPYAPKSYANGTPVTDALQEATNVKIEWELSPDAQQYETYTQTILSAAEDMPDIMTSVYGQDPRNLYEAGLIVDLKPLIDSVGVHTKKYLEEHPDILGMITEPDGTILSIPTIQDGENFGHGLMIRKDWLGSLPHPTNCWRSCAPSGTAIPTEMVRQTKSPAPSPARTIWISPGPICSRFPLDGILTRTRMAKWFIPPLRTLTRIS